MAKSHFLNYIPRHMALAKLDRLNKIKKQLIGLILREIVSMAESPSQPDEGQLLRQYKHHYSKRLEIEF